MRAAETRIVKAVFPNTTNHYDTLFGGTALQLMDEVAFYKRYKVLQKTCCHCAFRQGRF